MIWVDLVRTLMMLLIPALYAMNALTLERLYLLVFLTAIVSTVFGPALASAVPHIVNRSQLTSANALIQGTAYIGILVGPAACGVGIALIGSHNVLYIDAATFLVSALCLMPIRVRDSGTVTGLPAVSETFADELLAGFRFVFLQHSTIFILMMTATLYSLGASAFVFLLPVFAKESLRVGPLELGWLWSALGIGMLVTSAWLVWINQGDLHKRLRIISGSTAVGGLAVCCFSQLDTASLACVLMVVIGGSSALFTPVVWALLQEITPAHLLGRVFTTFSTGSMSSAMAGMAGFGWAADTVGPAASLIGIGMILLGTATVAALFSRRCVALPVAQAASPAP
jgi:MFS family permease